MHDAGSKLISYKKTVGLRLGEQSPLTYAACTLMLSRVGENLDGRGHGGVSDADSE
jgi:hypothetical protein